jgi:hypothetical protein
MGDVRTFLIATDLFSGNIDSLESHLSKWSATRRVLQNGESGDMNFKYFLFPQ